jgi:TolB-like protein/Tfp pilus assembly protein PilF
LADGFVDALADRIGYGAPRIDVLGRRAYRRRGSGDSLSVRAVSTETGARYVLTGSLARSREMGRLSVVLYDAKTGTRKWTHTFPYDDSTAMSVEQTLAYEVASRISDVGQRDKARFARSPTKSAAAYTAMLRGDGATVVSSWADAIAAYRQASTADRKFTEAYAKRALAAAASLERGVELQDGVSVGSELRMAADRALLLDSTSALAWVAEARARVLEGRSTDVWRRAFDRALSLDARNVMALEEYGRALAAAGESSEAQQILRRAAQANPGRAQVLTTLAELAMADRRDGEACSLLNQALSADPLLPAGWALRALLRVRHDDLRFAWADAETATRLGNALLGESAAARVDLVARDTTRAKSRLYDVWRQVRARHTIGARDGSAVVAALLAAGQVSRALDVLEAVRPRGPWYAARLRDPVFDRVRDQPRFRALLTARGWPAEARLGGDVGTSAAKRQTSPRSTP